MVNALTFASLRKLQEWMLEVELSDNKCAAFGGVGTKPGEACLVGGVKESGRTGNISPRLRHLDGGVFLCRGPLFLKRITQKQKAPNRFVCPWEASIGSGGQEQTRSFHPCSF